jgi:hypothetical protein
MSKSKIFATLSLVSVCTTIAFTASLSQEEMAMPAPTAEHEWIAEGAGKWTGSYKMYPAPGAPATEGECSETAEMLGPFWRITRFEGTMMEGPFSGVSQFGFDPAKGKYISTWTDSMSPMLIVDEGTFNKATGILRMGHTGPDMTGRVTEQWSEETYTDGMRAVKMYSNNEDGSDHMWLEMTMKKVAGAKPAEAGSSKR